MGFGSYDPKTGKPNYKNPNSQFSNKRKGCHVR